MTDQADPSQEDITEDQRGLRPVARLLALTRPHAPRLALAAAFLLGGGALSLLYPRLLGSIIDASFTDHDLSALAGLTLTLLAIFVAQAVIVFFRQYLLGWVGERVVADLRVELATRLLHQSQAYYHRARTGELLARVTADVTRVQETVTTALPEGAVNLLTIAGGLAVLLYTNPLLTAVMLAVVPPTVIATVLVGRRIRALSQRAQDQLALASGELQEAIAGVEMVQSFCREEHVANGYREGVERGFELSIRSLLAGSAFSSCATLAACVTMTGVFWLGGAMVARGELSAGALTEFMLYTIIIGAAVAPSAALWGQLQGAAGATARLFGILEARPEITTPATPAALPAARGELTFEDLSFGYRGRDQLVLRDINLRIKPGTTCALVGGSGSGKSTLSRLARRLHDPHLGRVLLDGHDLRRLALHDLRAPMAVVSQEPTLLSGTIADNIRFGRLDASDAELEAAARQANAHDFILDFPDGYQTRVGERGAQLSGGQRQRVAIARAILRDPRVLILDEATSALDAHSEGLVQDALDRLKRGRTTLIIAHRLSTIVSADHIAVLERGRVVEEGRHEQLLARGGAYAQLVARQTEGAAPPAALANVSSHALKRSA